jgi:NAD(P)H-dependent FMN reductase
MAVAVQRTEGHKRPKIGILLSTIREGRFGEVVGRWVLAQAARRHELACELVDLRDYPLPLFVEPDGITATGEKRSEVIARWQRKLAELDGYIFVTAEYNHSIPGVLKNALDHAYAEYRRKPAAFVGYGGVGGARAVEQLRLICIEFQLAPLRSAVHIGPEPYHAVTREGRQFSDFPQLQQAADALLDDLVWWTYTLRAGRREQLVA